MTFTADRLCYGGDYNPEQWLDMPEVLEQDIRMLKDAGCNTVTLGVFAWSVLEPEEGKYETAWLEQIVQRLYENGIRTILSTPSGARPKWLADRYPQVLRTDADRRKRLYGTRHNHCFTSPVYREKTAAIDEVLSRRLGSHPGVILWHISNELGGECHCSLCQEAFRGWLKKRYDSIEALNRAWATTFWSHCYGSFEEIESPSPIGEDQLHALKLNWQRFVTYQTADFLRNEVAAIRRGGSTLPVTTNLMYYFGGLDYFKLAGELDVVSWDTYPTWHKGRVCDVASDNGMCHDLMRSLKDRPFLQIESCLSSTNWQGVSYLKRPGMQLAQTLQAVAHGADASMFFQVRQSRGSSEKFHGALIDHYGGEDTRVYREAQEGGAALAALRELAGTRVNAEAAILYDWENKWALEDSQGPRNSGMPLKQMQLNFYRALRRRALDVDLIDEDCSQERLNRYRILILPMMYMLRKGFAEKLKAYVSRGGIVIGSFWSGVADEDDLCYLGPAPHDLTDLFGIQFEEIDGLPDGRRNTMREPAPQGTEKNRTCSQLCELVRLCGAQTLLVYGEDFYAGKSVLTYNPYGKGGAYYLAACAEEPFYDELLGSILERCAREGRPVRQLLPLPEGESASLLPDGLEVSSRQSEKFRYLIIQNFSDQALEIPALPEAEVLYQNGLERGILNVYGAIAARLPL